MYFRGLAVLSNEGVFTYSVMPHADYLTAGLTDSEKYLALARGTVDTVIVTHDREWPMQVISTGPFSLQPGQSDTAAFVVIAGDSRQELLDASVRARDRWTSLQQSGIGGEGGALPTAFALRGNYPNPFNAGTVVLFSLDRPQRVRLAVYNILGQAVITLHSGMLPAGAHEVQWDGRLAGGLDAPSGVYFYRLEAAGQSQTLKMLLLR
jgi:hypothetical protein